MRSRRLQAKGEMSTPQTGKFCHNGPININILVLLYVKNCKRALSVNLNTLQMLSGNWKNTFS